MNRREALSFLSQAAAGAGMISTGSGLADPSQNQTPQEQASRKGLAPVKIRDIKTILTAPDRIRLVIVKVETTEPGLHGWGCATFHSAPTTSSRLGEKYLKPFLIGRNVDEIEDIWQSSYMSSYWRNGPRSSTR